jgi:D-lactate dehydrogenase (cytochrome)
VRLRLYGVPEAIAAATCAFESLKGAVDTVIQLIQLGVPVARVEFLDEVQVRACNADSNLGLPERPHLMFEFHGSTAGVAEQARTAAALAADNGGADFQWAERPEDRSRLWRARRRAYFAAAALRPGSRIWASDVCVPVSRLAEAVLAVREDIDRHGLVAPSSATSATAISTCSSASLRTMRPNTPPPGASTSG